MIQKIKNWKWVIALSIIVLGGLIFLSQLIFAPSSIPKPRGYFRIDLPAKDYVPYQGDCPLNFEIGSYNKVEILPSDSTGSCWFQIRLPKHRATVHCSYFPVQGNLDQLIQEAYDKTAKHDVKATSKNRTVVRIDSTRVYGLIYDLQGDAASQLQFYVTDSTDHFLWGALYFWNRPNADSLAPVLQFMREDVIHLINTLHWKEN
jgi:gliding motility-associated lipoprotein GldD